MRLAGYTHRHAFSQGIGQRLQASALILQDNRGRRLAIIALDLLFVGAELVDRLRTFAGRALGIDGNDLLVSASHTHFAPSVDASKPALGEVDREYLDWVSRQCCELLRTVVERPMQFVQCRSVQLQWNGAVYRRLRWWLPHIRLRRISVGGVVTAPNRRRQINRSLRLLELVASSGDPIALVWSASCHPVGWPNELELSSDYIGVVREQLGAKLGYEAPVLFLQGFAGDLRPDTPEKRKLSRRLPRILLYGPNFDEFDRADWQTWTNDLVTLMVAGLDDLRRSKAIPLMGSLASACVKVPLTRVLDGHSDDQRSVLFQRLRLGGICDILSVSAEPCSMLLPMLDDSRIWPVGYSGDAFGYWPTDQQRREGGYEAAEHLVHFNLPGKLRPGLDRLFQEALTTLSCKLESQLNSGTATIPLRAYANAPRPDESSRTWPRSGESRAISRAQGRVAES